MKPKYTMTVEQNVAVAKRNITGYIWDSANLSGIDISYPDTETIVYGVSVAGMKVDDMIAIYKLRQAWRFLLENVGKPTDYPFICELNRKVCGTKAQPDMHMDSQLQDVLAIDGATDKALTLMLYIMRKQMFFDGNKRTAMLAANHVMIANGAGIITIPIKQQNGFRNLLIEFYESGDMENIKAFLYEHCIDGIDFPHEPVQEPEMQ